MYIPIGNDMAVRDRSIVGIFESGQLYLVPQNPGVSEKRRGKRRSGARDGQSSEILYFDLGIWLEQGLSGAVQLGGFGAQKAVNRMLSHAKEC